MKYWGDDVVPGPRSMDTSKRSVESVSKPSRFNHAEDPSPWDSFPHFQLSLNSGWMMVRTRFRSSASLELIRMFLNIRL